MIWATHAAMTGGKWYRGVVEATDCFTVRWHRDEAKSNWLHHAEEDAKSDGNAKGWGSRGYQPY